jgi:hypothetical protein
MADTFLLTASCVPMGPTVPLSMLALFNGSGSGVILRVYRVWLANSSNDVAFTGTQGLIGLSRITAATASNWTLSPAKCDSNNTSLPAQVISGCKFTVTTSDLFRRLAWSNDEPAQQTMDIDGIEVINGTASLFDTSYNDANTQPIVCREGQGVSIQTVSGFTATAPANAGYLDMYIEFTSAAT